MLRRRGDHVVKKDVEFLVHKRKAAKQCRTVNVMLQDECGEMW